MPCNFNSTQSFYCSGLSTLLGSLFFIQVPTPNMPLLPLLSLSLQMSSLESERVMLQFYMLYYCSHSSFFFLTFLYGLTFATFLSIYTLPLAQHPSYSCAAMHSLFTLAQLLCTVCLLLRSRYAQSVYLCAALLYSI